MGFKNVCMKFKIFVCDDCKSAHQAFSHRCKSVTMSHWTKEEVNSLTAFNGGGNAVNRATMLANVPPNLMPKKGCHPTELKEFVQEAYDNKRWHDPNGQVAAKAAPAPAPAPAVGRTTSMPPAGGLQPPRVVQMRTAPAPSTSAAVDLLGLSIGEPAPAPADDLSLIHI